MIKNLSDSQIRCVGGGLINPCAAIEPLAIVLVDSSSPWGIALAAIGIAIDLTALVYPHISYLFTKNK